MVEFPFLKILDPAGQGPQQPQLVGAVLGRSPFQPDSLILQFLLLVYMKPSSETTTAFTKSPAWEESHYDEPCTGLK